MTDIREMQILHVAYSKKAPIGIQMQMQYEFDAVKKINICWDTVLFSTVATKLPFMIHINPRLPSFLQWLKVYWWVFNKRKKYDFILFRNIKADFIGWIFTILIHNIITIHHTKEIEECKIVQPFIYGKLLACIEKYFGRIKLKSVFGIAGVTKEITEYELKRQNLSKPIFIIPNGIYINSINNSLIPDERNGKLKAIFVSSNFDPWQGLDLILDSYLKNPNTEIELHLIGNVEEKYIKIIQHINKTQKLIYLHGTLQKNKLYKFFTKADIGFGSFALFRKGLTEACALKIREYLAFGIPVYAGHIDSGLPPDFPYYFRGNPDICEIENQAMRCRTIPRAEVIESARPFIDKAMIIERTYRNLSAFY